MVEWNYGNHVDEGTTPRVLTIGIPTAGQKQDGRSKPMKPKTS
jgi:hypothetical protein